MIKKIKTILKLIFTFVITFIIVGSVYFHISYPFQDFEVILFTLRTGVEKSSPDVTINIIKTYFIYFLIIWILLFIPTIKNFKNKIFLDLNIRNKFKKNIQLFPIAVTSKHICIYFCVIFLITLAISYKCLGVDEYFKNKLSKSTIFEDYYIDPKSVKLELPEKPRNLILIIGESFENTVFSKENGGVWDDSLMPELEEMALKNTSFSNSDTLGGPSSSYGTNYSAGGNVAISAGIPIKQEFFNTNYSSESTTSYLEGACSIGELLNNYGYNSEIIMGSDGKFGLRKQFYECNGNYKVFDVNYAIENGKMNESDKVWWGFCDDDLYKWSKEEILDLASTDKPFNFVIVTADTHFPDGYLSSNAKEKYPSQYENVYTYSSELANEFVNWVKSQDFYEDTTIVIIGDHIGMQNQFYEQNAPEDYKRSIYNVFLNAPADTENKFNRTYTLMDMFPTIIGSLGIKIENDRLGMGTNLFSNTKTIPEEIGYDYFEDELKKRSQFYNEKIVGKSYYKHMGSIAN